MNEEQKALYDAYDPNASNVDLSAAHGENTFDITQRKDFDKTDNSVRQDDNPNALSVRKY